MQVEPNKAKHQDIILKVCKKHNIKSLQLTELHIELMDDCITEYANQYRTAGKEILLKKHGYNFCIVDKKPCSCDCGAICPDYYMVKRGETVNPSTSEWISENEKLKSEIINLEKKIEIYKDLVNNRGM